MSLLDHAAQLGIDFVSYDAKAFPQLRSRSLRARGMPVSCWTIRSEAEAAHARAFCDQITFEGYTPALV